MFLYVAFVVLDMDTVAVSILCFSIFAYVTCEELHVVDNKPGACYKIHTPNQPHFYPNPRRPEYKDLFESCTEWLQQNKTCLGLRTQNDEMIVVSCKGVSKRNRPGCYKIINRDKREEIVCQKLNVKEGCETITTKTGLNVVVHCGARGFVKVKKSKRVV